MANLPMAEHPSAIDQAEMYFLIAHALAGGPFAHLGEALAKEAADHGVFPSRVDYTGARHPLSYDEARQRLSHLHPGSLQHALHQLLVFRRGEARGVASQGLSSLLDPAILPGAGGLPSLPGYAAKPPTWMLPLASAKRGGMGLPAAQFLMLRECGVLNTRGNVGMPPAALARHWEHHLTVRGHSFAAYCVVMDGTGRHVITGSDDRLVKVWSARTGLLVCTCRGHMQEISDLSVNMDSTLFASASVDGVIRVWTLSGATAIGAPVAVLKAHTSIVTAIDFSPVHPNVLLSSSYDGTCRVWNVRDAAMPPVVVQWASPVPPPGGTPWWAGTADGHRTTRLAERRAMGDGHNGSNGAQHGHAQQRDERSRRGAPEAGPSAGQGAIIDLVGDEHEGGEGGEGQDEDGGPVKFGTASFSRTGEYIFAGAKDCCTYVWHWPGTGKEEVATSSADPAWPQATEVARLEGHRNDVYLLQHSHGGTMIATGSKDGTIRIWRRPRRARRRGAPAWECEATLSCPVDEEAVQLARQRRRQLPPPRVDQIAWNADDTFLVASMEDQRVHVFATPLGRLVHSLSGHTDQVHVVLAHPTNSALAVSASYGGEAFLWDIKEGKALRRFDSRDTRPDGRTWPEGLPFVDGYFSAMGDAFVLADAAGQLHFFGIGPKSSLTARAPYDQFLSTDYEALLQDVDGNVASAETQIPAHVLTGRELLGDITGAAYPASLQRAYRAGRLLEVSASDADWRQPGQQPGYLLAAPTLTAAAWRVVVVEGRTSEAATQNAIARASARLEEHERHLDAGRQRAQQTAARTAAGGAGPSAPRERRQEVQYLEDDDDQLSESSSEEEDEEGRGGGRESRARARSVRHSERLAGRRQPTPERPRRARTADELREQQRAERERRALRRQIAHMQALEQQRRRQERAERSRNGGRLGPDDADDFNLVTSEEEEDDYSEISVEEEFDSGDEDGAGPSTRPARRRRREESGRDSPSRAPKRQRTSRAVEHRPRPSKAATGRLLAAYNWLLPSEYSAWFYVPQAGDEVVYVREGHAAVLEATMDARLPPWKVIPRGRTMRPAEPCTVTALQYVIAEDATAATVARVTLQLSDPASPLSGQRFTVDIPSPASGQAEFVILRSRFDAAVAHKWAVGDECLGYWQTGTSEEGIVGEWWRGRVTEDRRGSSAVGTDPFTCGGLWECYTVQWEGPVSAAAHPESSQGRNDENGAGPSTAAAGQPPSPTAAAPEEGDGGEGGAFPQNGTANGVSGEKSCDLHSPWELHPLSAETADPLPPGTPHLDVEVARRAAAAIAAAAAIDRWAIFQAAPEWDEAYRSLTTRAEFYNRRIPLPLGLMDVTSRLELGYYRHASALEHDIRTIADNAAVFNGPSSDIAADAKCMAQYLLAVVGGEEGADPQVYAAMADEAQEVGEEEHGDPEGSDEDAGGGVQPRSRARRQPLTWWNGEQDGSEEQERAPRSRRPSRRAAAAAAEGEGVGRSGRYSLRDHSQRVRYSDVVGVDESDEEERGQRRRVREPSPPPVHGYSTRRAEHHHAEHAVAAVAEVTQGPRSGVGQNEEGSAPRTRIRLSLRR